MNRKNLAHIYLMFCLLWAGAIAWLSLIPSPPSISISVLGWDKFQHAFAYALLTILAQLTSDAYGQEQKTAGWKVLVLVMLFSALIEIAQGVMTANRSADVLDFAANMIGSGSGYLLFILFRSRLLPQWGG